ncbi:glycoside hydrolase family 57 protein [Nitratifractor salsuginis]|uniref:glycoside hydrolase family 57 protein n=1 Tax=Nitratifractor salsuginis TaxID=269261 RepID=UPI00030C3D10|nr:glycoside hydrolase family 57 protein [Nitratifractor salsuginis]
MNLVLLWHMHQPDYRDESGRFIMPWVFLHAIKDYYDMPWLLSRSKAKASFNLTPILIEQLDTYIAKGPQSDRFLSLWLKDPARLSADERDFVVQLCKSAQYETMVKPLPSFDALYSQEEYSDEELVNLECCFLLSWCGPWLREKDATVKKLLPQERFDAKDKEALLDALFDFLPEILPFYDSLRKKGQITLSTTPYSHPILPLLIDIHTAELADPSTPLPPDGLSLASDAKLHLQKAKEIYRSHFGSDPVGMWPAEGAVDPQSAELFQEAGIRWIATDQAILQKSGGSDPYRVYDYRGLKLFFRDHELSDLIGFSYRTLPAERAVEDFRRRLAEKKGTLFVILDGENAWEYYPNNGREFLEKFYAMIEEFAPLTCDEAAALPAKKLERLAPGSWIDGTFRTWIGDEEKNRAWELLFQTRRDVRHLGKEKDPQILAHFLAAEASDWFWWYGEGHYTEFAREFDRLYRDHLISIYELMGLPAPRDLLRPIVGSHTIHNIVNEPKAPIQPVIDGRVTSFFEWVDAGMIDERHSGGSMQNSSDVVERIFWGSDGEYFYFRLDAENPKELELKLFFDEEEIRPERMAAEKIIEIAVAKKGLEKRGYEVRFEISADGKILATLPSSARLFVNPDENYAQNWFV